MPKQEFRLEAMKIYDKMRHSWDIVGCLTDSLEELVEKTQFKEHELYIDEDAKPSLPMSADVEKAKEAYVEVPVRIMERWISALSMCDGNSHATTERTCETCDDDRYEYKGAIHQRVEGIWFRIENNIIVDRDQYRHDLEARVKPIPAAQDAKECSSQDQKQSMVFIDATPDAGYVTRILSAYIDDSYYSDNTIGLPTENPLVKQMNEWREKRNDLIREAISKLNDCPSSLPMSVEVEKAIETVRCVVEHSFAKNDFDLIVAALKVRGPLVSEPDFEEHDLYVYDDARPL